MSSSAKTMGDGGRKAANSSSKAVSVLDSVSTEEARVDEGAGVGTWTCNEGSEMLLCGTGTGVGSLGGVELRRVGVGVGVCVGERVRRRKRLRVARIALVKKRTSLTKLGWTICARIQQPQLH